MLKQTLTRGFAIFSICAWSLSLAAIDSAQHAQIESTLLTYQNVIVRVSFDNEKIGKQIASQFEPMQSFYDKGYVTLHLDSQEYSNLSEIANDAAISDAITVTIDDALTNKYIAKDVFSIPEQLTTATIPSFACYRTVEETFATAQSIANNNPALATWTDVGDSWEKTNGLGGYDSMVLKLTNSAIAGPKPKIFITSAIHAREYTTAELMTRFAEKLVAEYGTDPDITWILDHQEVHMMLVTNPDGRKQAESGLLWRKNTNQNYCSATSQNRGADLNRNFSYRWNCCNGSSTDGCNQTFHGSGPRSEPEVQAVEDYLLSNFTDDRGPDVNDAAPLDKQGIYLDIHSSGRLMLWPWGFTSNPAPNGTQLQTLGRKMAFFNGHEPKQSIGLYPTDGTTTTYAYGELGLAAYTYELGTEFFESCSYFENTLIPDNIPALMYALKSTRAPYQTPAGPDATSVSTNIGDAGVPAGTQIDLTATLDDTRFNNQNGAEPTQNIAAAEFYIDTPPWQTGASAIAMTAADGTFNASIETAVASVDTSGLSNGRHTVFVRSQDTSGNWGTVTAEFINIDPNGSIPTTVFEDNFESNLGWTTNPSSTDTATTGQWQRANPESTDSSGPKQLGTTVSGVNDLVTGATAGASVGTNDIDNGPTSIRSPDILLPNADSVSVSFSYYLAHTNNASTDDYLRVSAVSASGTTLLLEELGAPNDDDGVWETFAGNLDALAGQQIYLLAEAADAAGGSIVEAGIDDVKVIAFTSGGGNTPPSVTNPGAQTDVEGNSVSLQISATDNDGDTLSYSASGLPNNLGINSTSGLITGTLENNSAGNYNVTVTVSDGLAQASATFDWTVNNVNQAPVLANLGNQTANEGSAVSIQLSATDADNDTLTYSANGLPNDVNVNSNTGLISGSLSFTSAGIYNISASVSDGTDSDTMAFTLTVNNTNRAPVITNPGAQVNVEGDTIALTIAGADPDGDGISFSASGLPLGLGISAGGVITGTATTASTFAPTITATDGTDSSSISFNWTITPEGQVCNTYASSNVPISLPNGTNSISSALSISGAALVTDVNVSINMPHAWPGDLIFTLTNESSGTAVTIIDQPGVPASNFGCSNDNIDVTLDDDATSPVEDACSAPPAVSGTLSPNNALSVFNGEAASGTWTLGVTDTYPSADAGTLNAWSIELCASGTPPVNNPPVVTAPGNQSADEGGSVSIQINASDADNDSLSYGVTGLPAGISINPSTGLISGSLSFTTAGSYNIDVNVSDGTDSANTSFTLTVNNINRAPTITNPGNQISVEGDSVVLNVAASDEDGDNVTFSASGLPANLAMSSTGTINGSLATGSAGAYSVTVTASDGTSSSSTTFDWTVTDGSIACTSYSSTDVPVPLPNGTASITSNLSISGAGTISDINVSIDMPHAWPGDLTLTLTNQSSGTAVTVIDRPGVPSSTWGCSNDNIDVILDDDATSAVEAACTAPPAISGTLSPNNALSAFNGEAANGTWALTVADAYTTGDNGTLNAWSVEICSD